MKLRTTLIVLILIPITLLAQNEEPSYAVFNFGRSYTGTGDLRGFQYGINYREHFEQKQLYWSIGFEGTLHDDESIDYIFADENGNELSGKSRYVTSGLQLVGTMGYDVLKNQYHDLGLAVGPVIRYQSSSIPDMVEILYPALTDLPYPVKIETFTEPIRTFAIGAVLKLEYDYIFKNNYLVGFIGGFQFDTNGDTIGYISFAFGKKF